MLKTISKESKALILLEFTRELLMHSASAELFKLKRIIKEEEMEKTAKKGNINQKIRESIKEKISAPKNLENIEKPLPIIAPQPPKEAETSVINPVESELGIKPIMPVRIRPRVLRIPEPRLPPRLQYLKPTAQNIQIDLPKINSLLNDPLVRTIECNGPGEKIVVTVPMIKNTNIILSKDEISDIVQIFEEKSKIPATEGMYNVVVGRLIFSAIISDVIGSKFVIKKMNYTPVFR